MTNRYTASVPSPIGTIVLQATSKGICSLEIDSVGKEGNQGINRDLGKFESQEEVAAMVHLKSAIEAIDAYLNRGVSLPELPLDISGTPFQRAVWQEIARLDHGQSATYGEIAVRIGNPKAMRAVGAAVGANPVPLLIGCHRVLGSGNRITGYSGGEGLPTKRLLLKLERIGFRE